MADPKVTYYNAFPVLPLTQQGEAKRKWARNWAIVGLSALALELASSYTYLIEALDTLGKQAVETNSVLMLTTFSYLAGYTMKLIIFGYGFHLLTENTYRTKAQVDSYLSSSSFFFFATLFSAMITMWSLI